MGALGISRGFRGIRAAALLGLGVLTSAVRAGPPSNGPFYIVFDLDHTLLSELAPGQDSDPSRTVMAGDRRYRVTNWAAEAICLLSRDPRVDISFFSSGSATRNSESLKNIRMPACGGRSLDEVPRRRVWSKEDMVPVDEPDVYKVEPGISKYVATHRKELMKVSPELGNVVIVDDHQHLVPRDEWDHVLWLKALLRSHETYEAALAEIVPENARWRLPTSRKDWLIDRHRMAGAYDILREALEGAEAGQGGFAELVHRFSTEPADQWPRRIIRGMRALSSIVPEPPATESTEECVEKGVSGTR